VGIGILAFSMDRSIDYLLEFKMHCIFLRAETGQEQTGSALRTMNTR
jgi:hypothetical protein